MQHADGHRKSCVLLVLNACIALLSLQEHGARRLRTALICDDSVSHIRDRVAPFLSILGSDALCAGPCKASLATLLDVIYRVPGLLPCMHTALSAGSEPDAARALGWFVLNVAIQQPDARTDPEVSKFVEPLKQAGGAAHEAGAKLEIVLAGGLLQNGGVDGIMAAEDLAQAAGGRHDNDHADFRSISINVTSEEVCDQWRLEQPSSRLCMYFITTVII